MGVHLGGDGKGEDEFWDNGGVHLEKSEHSCAVHFYSISSGLMWGDWENTGSAGGDAMVRAGGNWSGGGKGDISGNGGGGGGQRRDGRVTEGTKEEDY